MSWYAFLKDEYENLCVQQPALAVAVTASCLGLAVASLVFGGSLLVEALS